MRLSAGQIYNVINDLPSPKDVEGNFYKVAVREQVNFSSRAGNIARNAVMRCIEFEKSADGREWLLHSMPQF